MCINSVFAQLFYVPYRPFIPNLHPSYSYVSEAGIELPWTERNVCIGVKCSNHSARSHPKRVLIHFHGDPAEDAFYTKKYGFFN